MDNFDKFERNFKAGAFLIVVFNIALLVAIVCGVVYGCNKIREKGLKGCVESVWNGPTNAVPASTNSPAQ